MSIRTDIGLTRERLKDFRANNITAVCPNCNTTGADMTPGGFKFHQIAQIEYYHYWFSCSKCKCKFSLRRIDIPAFY